MKLFHLQLSTSYWCKSKSSTHCTTDQNHTTTFTDYSFKDSLLTETRLKRLRLPVLPNSQTAARNESNFDLIIHSRQSRIWNKGCLCHCNNNSPELRATEALSAEGLVQTQPPRVVRSPKCSENLAKGSSNPFFQDLRQILARIACLKRTGQLSCLKINYILL